MNAASGPADVLQTTALPAPAQVGDLIGRAVSILDQEDAPDDWLDRHGGEVRCLVTHAMKGADRALLDRLPGLELIANFGAGLDLIDLADVRRRRICVTATGDLLTEDVADLALWFMLSLLRGNAGADGYVRAGRWSAAPFPLGRSVRGRRLGIMGLGRIGQAVARRGAALGMEIAYHGRRATDGVAYGFEPTLLGLAHWSDLLVAAAPGGPATDGTIDAAVLDALGRDGYLINIARGSIVDEPALIAALTGGRLGGAALDVFDREPNPGSALLAAPRLLLSPHIGSATQDVRRAMLDHVTANVRGWLRDRTVDGVVR